MNNQTIEIKEDDLHAYVDKQLSAEKVKAVEALMLKDTKVAQQIAEWQQQNNAINDFFGKQTDTKIPAQLNVKKLNRELSQRNKTATPWFYSVAASLFLVVISGSAGWFANGYSQPLTQNTLSFVNSAISAHQVYSVEVLHPVEVSADRKNHLVTWLSNRIEHQLTVPNLKKYNYNLLGGRLLAMQKGKPAAQFMYENTNGERVTLLISKNKTYLDQSFHLKKSDDINTLYWMNSKIAYSVTGKMNSNSLREISNSIYQQLIEGTPQTVAGL